MLSQIKKIGDEPNANTMSWLSKENLGTSFEEHVNRILLRSLKDYFQCGARIMPTKKTRDHGKDIIIESPVDLENIMGLNFYLKGKSSIRIYIECKSSDSGKISLDKFSANLSRVENDNVDYFVLVTNNTIGPYAFYQAVENARQRDIEFYLVDEYILASYFINFDAMIGNYQPPKDEPKTTVEYQILKTKINGKPAVEIYLFARNYLSRQSMFNIKLSTDRNWSLEPIELNFVLEKNNSEVKRLIALKEYNDGIDGLFFQVKINNDERIIELKNANITYDFIPPLHGQTHINIINNISNQIMNNYKLNVITLFGEAGVGKTRILDEISKKVGGQNFKSEIFICGRSSKQNLLNKIKKYLIEEDFIDKQFPGNNLYELSTNIHPNAYKCILIIEDIHNADVSLYDDLRKLSTMIIDVPLTIIIVGRNDFSIGNKDYYSFLEWCSLNHNNPKNSFDLRRLTDRECLHLIKSLVNDVPEVVLHSVQKMSQNIPLYIVQFIEHMLEIKLVNLINRSTVGILDPARFSSKMSIPAMIDDIYRMRFNYFKEMESGKEIQEFLLMAAFVGITFKKEMAMIFLGDTTEVIELLIKRKFLNFTDDGDLRFEHESIYIFFRSMAHSSKELSRNIAENMIKRKEYFFEYLSEYDQARLYLWSNDLIKSRELFYPLIEEIRSIDNYSSININPDVYEFLDDVYDLVSKEASEDTLIKNTIMSKIYISLHYQTPFQASLICEEAEIRINKSEVFNKDKRFLYAVAEQRAHAYLNAGYLRRGEPILLELLVATLLEPENMDLQTQFDLYDRLANLYIKKNHHSLADKFIHLASNVAIQIGDEKLNALNKITNAKMRFYSDIESAYKIMLSVDESMQKDMAHRINCHNKISKIAVEVILNQKNMKIMISETLILLEEATAHNYANSIIRAHMILAILYYCSSTDSDCKMSLKHVSSGIDASIRFGIGTYIWQFYNLKAIIAVRFRESANTIFRLFNTVHKILNEQNLLFLGSLDFCYGNILALTNIMQYYNKNKFESQGYKFLETISHYNSKSIGDYGDVERSSVFIGNSAIIDYKVETEQLNQGKLLFLSEKFKYNFMDPHTGYYLIFF